MTKRIRTLKRTPAQQNDYAEKLADARSLLEELEGALNNEQQEAQSPINHGKWGYNGSLAHLNDELAGLLGFITGDDELADNGYEEYKARK